MILASQKLPLHLKKKFILSLCLWARGEREFPFPGNTSIKFSFPSHWKIPFPFTSRNPGMQFLISHPVPRKRNFQPGIRTGHATILYSLVLHTSYMWNLPMVSMTTSTILFSESKQCWINLNQILNWAYSFFIIPVSRHSRESQPQISLPVEKFLFAFLPEKRECNLLIPVPFP